MCSNNLALRLWTFLDPALDRGQSEDLVSQLLQVLSLFDDVGLHHEIQVIKEGDERQISPRESTANEIATVFLHLSIQTFHVKRNQLIGDFEFRSLGFCIAFIMEGADF